MYDELELLETVLVPVNPRPVAIVLKLADRGRSAASLKPVSAVRNRSVLVTSTEEALDASECITSCSSWPGPLGLAAAF